MPQGATYASELEDMLTGKPWKGTLGEILQKMVWLDCISRYFHYKEFMKFAFRLVLSW